MANPKMAKVGYLCPVCSEFSEIKKEGRTDGSIEKCSCCGEKVIFKSVVVIKPEETVEQNKENE